MKKYSARDILNQAIQIEEAGTKLYNRLSEMTEDYQQKNIFQVMANEELKHINIYKDFIEKIDEPLTDQQTADDDFDPVKHELLKDRIFNRLEIVQKAGKIKSVGDAMNYLVEIEIDVVNFFENFRKLLNVADQPQLGAVINEERSHVKMLVDLRQQYKSISLKMNKK